MEIEQGSVIGGKYRLERALAQGGMGSVWVAQHLQLDSEVAVKFMDPGYIDSDDARGRFEREAKASAMLKSPNVVQVYDYGVESDTPYIVMELLEGEDLDARLRREGRLSVSATARFLTDACKALRRAHEVGLIHRDLKPANLFLTHQGDEIVTKVLDFGIAKAIGAQLSGSGKATKTGVLVGSPYYMSPEQIRTGKQIDHRTDIWSLGVIAFECITGQLPFPSVEVGDVLVAICSDPIPPPTKLVPGLNPKVDEFFERALMRDPEQRFQSTREFAQALTALASSVEPAALPGERSLSGEISHPDSGGKQHAQEDISLAATALQDATKGAAKLSSAAHAPGGARPPRGAATPGSTLSPAGSSLIMQPPRGGRKSSVGAVVAFVAVTLTIGAGVAIMQPWQRLSLDGPGSMSAEPALPPEPPVPAASPGPAQIPSVPSLVSAAPSVSAATDPSGSAFSTPFKPLPRPGGKKPPPATSSTPSATPSAAPTASAAPSASASASASAGPSSKQVRPAPRPAGAAASAVAPPPGNAEPAGSARGHN